MTPEEQLRIIERARDATYEECYRPDLMEYVTDKCVHCELRDLATDLRAELERQAAA